VSQFFLGFLTALALFLVLGALRLWGKERQTLNSIQTMKEHIVVYKNSGGTDAD
jgi:hypothetical protein